VSDNVRVSVVVTVDDTDSHLQAAAHSALASDLRELEVLVLDASPSDRATSAFHNTRDPRLVKVRLRPGQGLTRLRNIGVARATAPYVAFLDANDLLNPRWLGAAVGALERTPEAGFAFADFEYIDAAGCLTRPSGIAQFPGFSSLVTEPLTDDWRLVRQKHLARGLLYENFIGRSGVVVRRKLFAQIGPLDESVARCADVDLWFRLAHHCDALYTREVSCSSRQMPGGDRREAIQASEDCISVLRREKTRWNERNARRQLDRRIAEKLASVAHEERQRGHRLRSTAMFAYAFVTYPNVRWLSGMLGSIVG
jgi:glycosyltransferase involved in cell wall biosynthesis